MKQKHIGLITMLAGLLGMAGALDTGCGWCTSGVLVGIGVVMVLMHYGKEKRIEKEDNHIAAQFLVTFYRQDKTYSKSEGRR